MAKVSINLVTWNGEKYIRECLNSILTQTSKDYFLLIIDNGSADETAQIIEREYLSVFGEKARLIKNKENIGFARAHNQALLWTKEEYVLVLNQDVVLDQYFLSEAVKFLDNNPKVGSLSPKLLKLEIDNQDDLKTFIKTDIIDSIGLKIFKSHRLIELGTGEKDSGQHEKTIAIFGPSATAPVYRRQALENVRFKDEFFDNDFFSYKEDIDIAYRLQLLNWQSFYLPTAKAWHRRSAKSSFGLGFFGQHKFRKGKIDYINFHSYKNHLFFLVKNLRWKMFFRYLPYIFFYELGKFLYVLFLEFKTLRGLSIFFAKLPKMLEKRKYISKNNKKGYLNIKKWLK